MPAEPIPPAQPARTMAHTFAACSRNDDGSRLRAATHRRASGRGRPQRTDPSTITSPASRPRTQISPGVRGRIGQRNRRPARNHSPPGPVDREALLQISRHGSGEAGAGLRGGVGREGFEPSTLGLRVDPVWFGCSQVNSQGSFVRRNRFFRDRAWSRDLVDLLLTHFVSNPDNMSPHDRQLHRGPRLWLTD
jgi:hypothetical protein